MYANIGTKIKVVQSLINSLQLFNLITITRLISIVKSHPGSMTRVKENH
jgi:hypothetical protein